MKELNFDKLEQMNFYGTDVSLDISLLEYGLLARRWENEEKAYQLIYVYEWIEQDLPKSFDITVMSESEIDELFDDLNDDNGLLDFVGMEESEWKQSDIVFKISDLVQYYGTECIFGSSYGGVYDYYELNKWINNN